MTSYSTYGAGTGLVEGDVSPSDEDKAAEQLDAIVSALGAGAARALLDTTHDINDPDGTGDEIAAVQWHSAQEGWELEAILEADRAPFLAYVRRFVVANRTAVIGLAHMIAWHERYASEMWHGNEGMAFYRVGMLLGYSGAHEGIGFFDYRSTDSDRLDNWVAANSPGYGWEQSWIDATEEPCLLHLSA